MKQRFYAGRKTTMTLKDFVRSKIHCSYDEAEEFISLFRHYDAVEYGRNIIENHADNFMDEFDVDDIDEDVLAEVAIAVEDRAMQDLSTIEDTVLSELFVAYR